MISYELAKQLKDAGFPIKRAYERDLPDGMMYTSNGPHYYDPSLEQLIEVCGDEFVMLAKRGNDWYAEGRIVIGNGSTPSEAVALLYLELNKK